METEQEESASSSDEEEEIATSDLAWDVSGGNLATSSALPMPQSLESYTRLPALGMFPYPNCPFSASIFPTRMYSTSCSFK